MVRILRRLTLIVLLLLISCGRGIPEGAGLRIAKDREEMMVETEAPALQATIPASQAAGSVTLADGPASHPTGEPEERAAQVGSGSLAISGMSATQASADSDGMSSTIPGPADAGEGSWSLRAQPVSATLAPDTPTAAPTAEPTDSLAAVCSPLELHDLASLRLIISDPYHPPPKGHEERHHGVDFSYYRWGERESIRGEGVRAVLGGVVALALADSFPYGNVVIVETSRAALPERIEAVIPAGGGQAVYTLYAHMEATPLVSPGDKVESCQALGAVGKSGNAGQAHLHLEMRLGPAGSVFTQMGYYTAQATADEKEAYKLWRTSGVFQHFDPMLVLGIPPNQVRQ